jgi:hypothetical protein
MKVIFMLIVLSLSVNIVSAQKIDKDKKTTPDDFTELVDDYADEIKAAQNGKKPSSKPSPNSDGNRIILNKGWGKIVLGGSETEVKQVFGERGFFGFEPLTSSSVFIYPEKGASVWTNRNKKVVKILFFGEYALNPPGNPDFGSLAGFNRATEFKSFAGVPEKISWRASMAQTVAACGNPDKEYEAKYGDVSVTVLKYGETSFYYRNDKLFKSILFRPTICLMRLLTSRSKIY